MKTVPVPGDMKTDVCEADQVLKDLERLALNEEFSDVTFVIDLEKIPAHRAILAARNEYFRLLLFGRSAVNTRNKEITLNVPSAAFKKVLNFLYTGKMAVNKLNNQDLVDVLDLTYQYAIDKLVSAISAHLLTKICLPNIFWIFNAVVQYNLYHLLPPCIKFIDQNAEKIIEHNDFNILVPSCLPIIFERDSFHANEIDIFLAILGWFSVHPTVHPDSMISLVRLSLINTDDLRRIVLPSGLVKPELLSQALAVRKCAKRLPHRGILNVNCDVVPKAQVMHLYTENSDVDNTDANTYLAKYKISSDNMRGLVFDLGDRYLLNYIKFQLWDQDERLYSYWVELSPDNIHWERVIDYSNYKCRSWQYLHFAARAVNYIRFVATTTATDQEFYVCKMVALYTEHPAQQHNGIVEPIVNVATVKLGATIVEGDILGQSSLINEHVVDINKCVPQYGNVVVRLAQPFYIGSMRLLLRNDERKEFTLYIDTSENSQAWEVAINKTKNLSSSWHHFTFTPRIVLYIRIKCSINNDNQTRGLCAIHLECPSQYPKLLNELTYSNGKALVSHDIPDDIAKLQTIDIPQTTQNKYKYN